MTTRQNVLILGGGASGLAAAVAAARCGARVTVLEKNGRVGKKLLATGNGRCNLANEGADGYFANAAFARAVLAALPFGGVPELFARLGLPTRADAAGRVYPACNQASAVLELLRLHLTRLGVRVLCDAPVARLSVCPEGYAVESAAGSFTAGRVIVCCGGLAAPRLGAADAYGLLTGLGCRLVAPAPALSPLETARAPIRGLSGLRLAVTLTLCDGARPLDCAQGEALFTDYGLSGVCAMQLARAAYHCLAGGGRPTVYVDFSPALGLGDYAPARLPPRDPFAAEPAMRAFLEARRALLPEDDLLLGALPRTLRERLAASEGALSRRLCAYPLPVTGVRGFDQAQVTQGGIDPADFSSRTLEHRRLRGLYACGEILDVDGDCGGFNLQFAFASGFLAGRAAAATSPDVSEA